MIGIMCCLKKGTEITIGYDRDYLDKDYYTIVKPKDFGNISEIARKGKRNLCKQIAKDYGSIRMWRSIEFYDREMSMDFYDSEKE